MAARILLTGVPGCGKTTLVRRVIEELSDLRLAGFVTEEVRGKDGRRIGFRALGLNGGSTMLASVDSRSRIRVGRYGVDLQEFESLIRQELQDSFEEIDLFVVDEVGKMECHSRLFVESVQMLFDVPKPALVTVALKGRGFPAEIKQREGVELIEVNHANRNELVDHLVKRLRTPRTGR